MMLNKAKAIVMNGGFFDTMQLYVANGSAGDFKNGKKRFFDGRTRSGKVVYS